MLLKRQHNEGRGVRKHLQLSIGCQQAATKLGHNDFALWCNHYLRHVEHGRPKEEYFVESKKERRTGTRVVEGRTWLKATSSETADWIVTSAEVPSLIAGASMTISTSRAACESAELSSKTASEEAKVKAEPLGPIFHP